MSQRKTRANYDELSKIAAAFANEEARHAALLTSLRQNVDRLRAGDWIGQGATAFFAEMDSQVFPTLQRLVQAMSSASRVTRTLNQNFKQAEEEAARLLNGEGVSVGSNAPGTSLSGGGVTSGGNSGGSAGQTSAASSAPAWQQANPLLAQDPATLFTEQNLDKLIGKTWQGEGSEPLKNAMTTLWDNRNSPNSNSPAVQQALQQIAEARGVPLEKIQADWSKYQQVLAQQKAMGGESEALKQSGLLFSHSDFMGSRGQLRYGQVVGDAFGVDPVFGALLNPTGGLVGPDNNAFDAGDTAVGYHGAVHDAAGYLINKHGVKPGYDYLGREGRDTSSPLSGQIMGIEYWRDKLPTDFKSEVSQGVMNVAVPVVDVFNAAKNVAGNSYALGSNAIDNVRELDIRGLGADAWRDGKKLAGDAVDDAATFGRDAINATASTGRLIQKTTRNALSKAWSWTPWG